MEREGKKRKTKRSNEYLFYARHTVVCVKLPTCMNYECIIAL